MVLPETPFMGLLSDWIYMYILYKYDPLCMETSRFVNRMFPYTEGRNCFIIFLPMFYRLSPLWGKIGLFLGSANFGKTSRLFYYHMTNLIQRIVIVQ